MINKNKTKVIRSKAKSVFDRSGVKSIPVFSLVEGKKQTTIKKPDYLVSTNSQALVHQSLVAFKSLGIRAGHSKTRGEVRGGGRKPWRQKGTGRARQGSIRAPHFIGGGVTFGPRSIQNKKKNLNKKMRLKAIISVLANLMKDQKLIVVDTFEIKNKKTKQAKEKLNKLNLKGRKLLVFASAQKNDAIYYKNLKKDIITLSTTINIYDLLLADYVIFSKLSLKEFSDLVK